MTIHLPKDLTVYDIDWFSIYCITATQLFAYINIPDSLNVPAIIDEEEMVIKCYFLWCLLTAGRDKIFEQIRITPCS